MSILTEYDEEKHMRLTRKQSREEGQDLLVNVIERLRGGEKEESILASGVDRGTVDRALSVM